MGEADLMNHYAGDVPWMPPAMSEADLRAFVRKEVHAVLDDLAEELHKHPAAQPVTAEYTPSGTCWACERHGEAEEMMWLDQFGRRSHLVHATEECIRAAEIKPEVREHRG